MRCTWPVTQAGFDPWLRILVNGILSRRDSLTELNETEIFCVRIATVYLRLEIELNQK